MSRRGSIDEQLLAQLLAPPDLHDGVEALDYWHRRSRHLPWYRVLARQEAVRMTARWEQRVRAAVVSQRRATLEARLSAGVLIGRTRFARWTRRARIALLAAVSAAVTLVAIPTVTALLYVLHSL
jgi:hypothetical protein